MSTTVAPPPATPPLPPAAPPVPPPRGSARVIAVLAMTLGGLLVVGTLAFGIGSAVRAASQRVEVFTTDATGVGEIDVDVAAADLTIVYGGAEIRLDVDGSPSDWSLTRDGDSVVVTTNRSWWGRGPWFGDNDTATLTLPTSLRGAAPDASLSLSAGSLRADGAFGELELDVSAGAMDVRGSARSLDADVSAGRLSFDLADVDEIDAQLSAGSLDGTATGSAPRATTLDVSAGRMQLTLPDETYAMTTDVSAGDLVNRLSVDPSSPRSVEVSVSAGAIVLDS